MRGAGLAASASRESWTGECGKAFGLSFRFQTGSGDAPVLRMLWVKEDGAWRITAYDVDQCVAMGTVPSIIKGDSPRSAPAVAA